MKKLSRPKMSCHLPRFARIVHAPFEQHAGPARETAVVPIRPSACSASSSMSSAACSTSLEEADVASFNSFGIRPRSREDADVLDVFGLCRLCPSRNGEPRASRVTSEIGLILRHDTLRKSTSR